MSGQQKDLTTGNKKFSKSINTKGNTSITNSITTRSISAPTTAPATPTFDPNRKQKDKVDDIVEEENSKKIENDKSDDEEDEDDQFKKAKIPESSKKNKTNSNELELIQMIREMHHTVMNLSEKVEENYNEVAEIKKKLQSDQLQREEELNTILQAQYDNYETMRQSKFIEIDNRDEEDDNDKDNDKDLKILLPSVKKFNFDDDLLRRVSVLDFQQREATVMVSSDIRPEFQWTNSSIDGFLKFLEDVDQFELRYDRKIKYLFPLIDKTLQKKIADHLVLYMPNKYNSIRKINAVATTDLIEVVACMKCPNNIQHFLKLLKASCKPYQVEQKTKFFKKTKSDLFGLRAKFLERYNFLITGCEKMKRKTAIPKVNFKPGGILNTWFELTPETTHQFFKIEINTKNYNNLEEFFDAYFEIVEETAKLSDSAEDYERRFESKSEQHKNLRNVNFITVDNQDEEYIKF